VPAYGRDPFGWLAAATAIAARRGADLLLPTQEQVAVLAAAGPHGFRTVVPGFAALAQVQDKLSAHATLARIGLPQPLAEIASTPAALAASGPLPAFVKTPIGTASLGVHRVATRHELRELAQRLAADGAFRSGGVLVQLAVVPGLIAAAATVIRPAAWRHFTGGSVNAYSLTPAAWQEIVRRAG
jgi:carbamoylphosphate synthase large subunit